MRVFAGMYPNDVSGMVLVDPMHDGDDAGTSNHPELAVVRDTVEQARSSPVPPGLPLVLIDALGPREVPFATAAFRQLRATSRLGIAADSRSYQMWLDTVPGSRLVVTERSGHNVPIEQPALVVETIRDVLAQAARPRATALLVR